MPLTKNYYCGQSTTQIIYRTIGQYLDEITARYPDSEALVVKHQNVRWTYLELHKKIERLATGLLRTRCDRSIP